MSLLMDALRKAEEAKKKAAQEGKSEEATPVAAAEKQQARVVVEKASEDSPAPAVELSMAAMEEVPKRSPVPSLETAIEFQDEEGYVLPTSLGNTTESVARIDSNIEQSPAKNNKASVELEQINSQAEDAEPETPANALEMDLGDLLVSPEPEPEQPQKPNAVHEALDLDSFESDEDNATFSAGGTTRSTAMPMASVIRKPGRAQGSRLTVKVAEPVKERARGRDGPERKTARNVFAAKRSPLLSNRNIKVATGGVLALVVVAIAAYFYASLNQESTFNIPTGSYVATEFVDNEFPSDTAEAQLSIDAATVAEATETIDAGDNSSAEQLVAGGDAIADFRDASIAPVVADTLIEPPAPEIVAAPEPSQSAANLQPELIAQETPQPEITETTIGDDPVVAPEAEPAVENVQPVAAADVQSLASAEPTNLISFRRQATVTTLDPNVDRAYAAYQQGSLERAEVLYRQALASDPTQRDALLGLATIAARNGNSTEALDLYSRLLARNPNDPIARAGLMEILPAGSPSEQEAELKRLLNDHPGVAALSYAYGNFLGSNQRWSEAQQAYFRALQLAKSDAAISGLINPDYAFNLAVSLEHLKQSEPAQNYYREALDHAANHPAGFDLAAVRTRLASMSGNANDE